MSLAESKNRLFYPSVQAPRFAHLRETGIILFGVVLMTIASQISIPWVPVPVTLQTVSVLLIGLTFSRIMAIKTLFSYLFLGALGVPVLAGTTGGIAVFLGPTGGYLLGFLASVLVMTSLQSIFEKSKFLNIAIRCGVGIAVIYLFGVLRLAHFVGLPEAIQLGFVSFIIPEVVKAGLLCLTLRTFK